MSFSYPLHNKKSRRNKKAASGRKGIPFRLRSHIRRLGLPSLEAYQNLCEEVGIEVSVLRSFSRLNEEFTLIEAWRFSKMKKKHDISKSFKSWLEKCYRGNLDTAEDKSDAEELIQKAFSKIKNKRKIFDFLMNLNRKTKLLQDKSFLAALVQICQFSDQWLHSIEAWVPKSRNLDKLFDSLVAHLLCLFPIPSFFKKVWFNDNFLHMEWYLTLAKGGSVRSLRDLPVQLTKKMAHYFLQAPESYTVLQAIRYGQVFSLGGDLPLVEAVINSRLGGNFDHDEFSLALFRFFIAHPMLSREEVGPIVDFIWHRKFAFRQVLVGRGVYRQESPIQPDFSLKGRTPQSLLKSVRDWHRELGRKSYEAKLKWDRSKIKDFSFSEGNSSKGTQKNWVIVELLSSKALWEEGRRMGHCVSSYDRACARGVSSIWSFRLHHKKEISFLLTIEVSLKSLKILQVRGKSNRLPTKEEIGIIDRWAFREGLTCLL